MSGTVTTSPYYSMRAHLSAKFRKVAFFSFFKSFYEETQCKLVGKNTLNRRKLKRLHWLSLTAEEMQVLLNDDDLVVILRLYNSLRLGTPVKDTDVLSILNNIVTVSRLLIKVTDEANKDCVSMPVCLFVFHVEI